VTFAPPQGTLVIEAEMVTLHCALRIETTHKWEIIKFAKILKWSMTNERFRYLY
jgi:hypothetical protein